VPALLNAQIDLPMSPLVRKLMKAGLLAALLVALSPLAMPLVHRALPPPVVRQPQAVLPPPGVKRLQKVEDLVFEMTNQARRAKGLAPLSKDAELGNGPGL
jgi:uncharacterized protein YkwD